MTHFTKGPWYHHEGMILRRHPSELYEYGGGVAGDKPIALVQNGWAVNGYPVEANAQLIAASPDMYKELKWAIDALVHQCGFAEDNEGIVAAKAALAKADGK